MSTNCNRTPAERQFSLFEEPPACACSTQKTVTSGSGRRFIQGDSSALFIGMSPLSEHLRHSGIQAPFIVADLLDAQDWSVFEERYAPTGRAPYAPRAMLGLILYGIMQGISSLRGLERMARVDLGVMWVTGGIAPDHANIGRFINQHESSLTQAFFESLTRSLLVHSNSSVACLAGDGTVIEAACSHYRLLKEEAVRERVNKAADELQQSSGEDREKVRKQLAEAKVCEQLLDERIDKRRGAGKCTKSLRISEVEPEAVLQRQKRGRGYASAYTPSVFANEDRFIIGHTVDPSNETRVVADLLDQSERVLPESARKLLLDTGYFHDEVIRAAEMRNVELFCSPKPSVNDKVGGLYHKSLFIYDAERDVYTCPAGQLLQRISHTKASELSREQTIYACKVCCDCPQRSSCTRAAGGRRIKRYPEDEKRLALQRKMKHPEAQATLKKRGAIVEPVFSALRQQQGLNRFRRRGLAGVKREFALHAMAHNLARAVALNKQKLLALIGAPDRLKLARGQIYCAKVFIGIALCQFRPSCSC